MCESLRVAILIGHCYVGPFVNVLICWQLIYKNFLKSQSYLKRERRGFDSFNWTEIIITAKKKLIECELSWRAHC